MMEARLRRVERLLAALTRLMGAVRRQVERHEQALARLRETEAAVRASYDRCGTLTDVAATGLTRLVQRLWAERARTEQALALERRRLLRLEMTAKRLTLRRVWLADQLTRKAMERDMAEFVGSRFLSAQG